MEFDFEYEGYGKKITFVSIVKNKRNNFRNYFNNLDTRQNKRFAARLLKIANDYGLEIQNKQIFDQLTGYNDLYEFKINSPAHRILSTIYNVDDIPVIILILGFPKGSEKAKTRHRKFYDKASQIIQILQRDKNDTEKNLRRLLGSI